MHCSNPTAKHPTRHLASSNLKLTMANQIRQLCGAKGDRGLVLASDAAGGKLAQHRDEHLGRHDLRKGIASREVHELLGPDLLSEVQVVSLKPHALPRVQVPVELALVHGQIDIRDRQEEQLGGAPERRSAIVGQDRRELPLQLPARLEDGDVTSLSTCLVDADLLLVCRHVGAKLIRAQICHGDVGEIHEQVRQSKT
eukprot:1139729-Pyramimonas_sp.AAC.1